MIKILLLIQIALILAKIAGICTLSWLWVTFPLWIGFALLAAIFVVALAVLIIYFFIAAVIGVISVILIWLVGD